MARFGFVLWVLCGLLPLTASAQNGSLFSNKQSISALFVPAPQSNSGSSLFRGKKSKFFAPATKRSLPKTTRPRSSLPRSIAQLLDLIALAEAGPAGYDAVQYGATIKPPLPPTQMTIGQVYDWIEATPGQPHAIGRYQFIPATLRQVVERKGYALETRFSAEVQDQFALILLRNAGLGKFQSGKITRRKFMKKLARVWAGLPLPTGKSYYDGYAGNAASITWVRFETGMAKIFPARLVQ